LAVHLLAALVRISRFIRYVSQVLTQAAVAIAQKEKRILVCQRKKTARYGLKWEFPGGKVEEGESFFDCLKRELREELSITVETFDQSESQVNRYDDGGDFEVTFFLSRVLTDHWSTTRSNKFAGPRSPARASRETTAGT
jgi:mutator protein MutT